MLLALPLILSVGAFSSNADDGGTVTAVSDLALINKFGNVPLVGDNGVLQSSDLEDAGIEYGDVVTLSFLDKNLDMPVIYDYNEVDVGAPLLAIRKGKVVAAINLGDFASEYFADKSSFEDESFAWNYKKGIEGPIRFTITLKEKGGMYAMFGTGGLRYTDKRSDYPKLSDEEYANFRPVLTTGMGRNILYRSSSPVNPRHKRNEYADAAMRKAGVRTAIDLADSKKALESFKDFDKTYYSTVDYIALNMSVNYLSEDYGKSLAEGLRFIASHDGPYLIHCAEGKDRAGLTSAVLECLMGASYDEVVRDYMLSYYDYYGITPDDEAYDVIAKENIVSTLTGLYGVDDLRHADLAAEAEQYLREIGMSSSEISALKDRLSTSYTSKTEMILAVIGGLAVIAAAYLLATKRR